MSNYTYTSSSAIVASDDDDDYACSICIEPFTLQDPAIVTSCKHEYHLQCIIEWSQRSKECPICWQVFVLIDPASQEILAAVEEQRMFDTRNISSSSPRSNIHHSLEDFHSEAVRNEESQLSSFDQQILSQRQLTTEDMANLEHISAVSHVEHHNTDHYPSPVSTNLSPVSGSRIILGRSPSSTSSLPEAMLSKLATASARYKESIFKRKKSLEKLLVRNKSMKELRKGMKREMNAGISGLTVMIGRLDIAIKRLGGYSHVSTSTSTASGSKSNNDVDKTESH